ncbi:hypothetical protein PVAG01_01077 [Phlyctema vagabunda]|uniref:Uncharacterized protein n=1 Tax=Phlyctema vagabunda TaxID=108571 RepID=A0ABR4PWI4_9HELO
MIWSLFLLLLLQAGHSIANTEKVIFLGPASLEIPVEHPTLDDLQLDILSPQRWSLRTHLRAEFPTVEAKHGEATWLVLNGLTEGQRYEVRICWAATQPTSFQLETYELQAVFENPELITSLARFSESRQPPEKPLEDLASNAAAELKSSKQSYHDGSSVLLLQILTAADYHTKNQTLMKHVPPVYVDIILDPFLFNVFPRSLVPTAAHILIVAVAGIFLSKYIARWIIDVATKGNSTTEKKTA